MAIVLALVITGWLIAFALGSQASFDSEPVAAQQSSEVKSANAQKTAAQKQTSAA